MVTVLGHDLTDKIGRYGQTVQDQRLHELQDLVGKESAENATQWTGVEVVFRQALVHTFGAPREAPPIERLTMDSGAFDSGEVNVAPSIGGIADEVS
jgi:hypothetical protein